jgi:hypothetical protein
MHLYNVGVSGVQFKLDGANLGGRASYGKRKQTVEQVFGASKRGGGFGNFLLRGA